MHVATKQWHSPKCEISNKQYSVTRFFFKHFSLLLVQFTDISLTAVKFPDILGFSTQAVTMYFRKLLTRNSEIHSALDKLAFHTTQKHANVVASHRPGHRLAKYLFTNSQLRTSCRNTTQMLSNGYLPTYVLTLNASIIRISLVSLKCSFWASTVVSVIRILLLLYGLDYIFNLL